MTAEEKTRYRFDEKEHAHFLDDRPLIGTTTAMNVLAKPLTWWAAGEAVKEFGWIHEKNATREERLARSHLQKAAISLMSTESYLAKLDKAYRAHDTLKYATATEGTDIHARCERYILYCINRNAGTPLPAPEERTDPTAVFARWACEIVERFRWAEAHCYSETLWTGGISDCGAILKDGRLAIIDFKRSKAAYFSHFVQLAGYALQITQNGLFTNVGVNILEPAPIDCLIVFPFGGGKPQMEVLTENYWKAFQSVVHLYQMQRDFDKKI